GSGKEQSAIRKPIKSEAARPVLLLLLWFLFPIISLFIVSQKAHSVFDIKSTIAFSAPFLILVSYGINKISNNLLRAGLLAIIIFLSAASLNTLYYSTRETKEQWREACNYLKNKCKADETIIVDPGYYKRFTFDYYFRNPVNKILTHEKINMLNKDIISAANFENSGKFWLIASTDDNYKLFDYFKKIRLNITDSRTYKGVVIYAFGKNAAQE
ncbi:MAG: hypothetical protein Q8903_14240, partial [Bacteroidota bacterium]|nr:hypothetical protein [Bacteroidota bacterium]